MYFIRVCRISDLFDVRRNLLVRGEGVPVWCVFAPGVEDFFGVAVFIRGNVQAWVMGSPFMEGFESPDMFLFAVFSDDEGIRFWQVVAGYRGGVFAPEVRNA